MSDITTLAKRIILIGRGKVLYDGSLKKLINNYGTLRYMSIKTNDKITVRNKGIISKKKEKDGYTLTIDTKIISISKLINSISKKIVIDDFRIENESIDNIIVKLYEEFKI